MLAALALALVLAGAQETPTATEAYFADFRALCLDNRGAPQDVVRMAEEIGWTRGPDEMVAEIVNPRAPEAYVWMAPEGGPSYRLVVSSSPRDAGTAVAHACVVEPRDPTLIEAGSLEALTTRWAGSDPIDGPPPTTWFLSGADVLQPMSRAELEANAEAIVAGEYGEPAYLVTVLEEAGGATSGMIRMEP